LPFENSVELKRTFMVSQGSNTFRYPESYGGWCGSWTYAKGWVDRMIGEGRMANAVSKNSA
jgi:hypothetical protein